MRFALRTAAVAGVGILLGLWGLNVQAAAAAEARVGPVVFSKLATQLPAGQVWLSYQEGLLCVTRQTLKGDGLLNKEPINEYGPLFMQEMNAGSQAKLSNLFAQSPDEGEGVLYELGGLVHSMDGKLCRITVDATKANLTMEVAWQVYSRAKHEVVATIETTGTGRFRGDAKPKDVILALFRDAFADAVRDLRSSSRLGVYLEAKAPPGEQSSALQERIALQSSGASPRPLGEEAGSVVLVKTSDGGFGSGVLVSSDGYILTDAHVVALEKTVTLRWSDGLETEGKVVRLHKKRDVALIKADPRGRMPLPIHPDPLQVGDTVFAIGAPLQERLQGTVTRGIVSAQRIQDGMALVQTDMAVNHGNSGGPILDDKGYVVGLTESSLQPSYGIQIGINYFTPIKDVLDFLRLDLPPAPLAAPAPTPPVQKSSAPAAKPKSVRR